MMHIYLIKIYFYISAFLPLEAVVVPVIVLFYIDYVGLTFFQYSNFMSLLLILGMIFEVPTGFFSDWLGRRYALLLGECFYMSGLCSLLYFDDILFLSLTAFLLSLGMGLSSGNLHSIGYRIFTAYGQSENEYTSFLAKIGGISVSCAAVAALLGGWLADQGLVYPMIADIFLLFMRIVSGFFLLILLWPRAVGDGGCVGVADKERTVVVGVNFWSVISGKKFLFSLFLGSVCFAVLRSSLNFYQPILSSHDWSGWSLGMIFSSGIILSALMSRIVSGFVRDFTIYFGYVFFLCILFFCIFLFLFDVSFIWYFFIGFLLHQMVRILVPSVASVCIQASIPVDYGYRTGVVSFSLLVQALCASLVMSITGFMISVGYDFQIVLVFIHVIAFIVLCFIYLVFRCFRWEREECLTSR